MTKTFAALCVAATLVLGISSASAGEAMLTKHKDVACDTCHQTKTPTEAADQAACIACHGQYKGKVVPNADQNPDRNPRRPVLEVNPHDSHLGDVRCTLCHREHTASPKETACFQCHKNFRLNAK